MGGPTIDAPRAAASEPEADPATDPTRDTAVAPDAVPTGRSVTIRGHRYPVVLPRLVDPRLHVAAVIVTIHVLGQLGLHFWVSVPQILAAILTAAGIELAVTFVRTRSFVWPASAMLTGSGVALILRFRGRRPTTTGRSIRGTCSPGSPHSHC